MLSKYKDAIASIGSIATAIGVIGALYFSIQNTIIQPRKPALDMLTTKTTENTERLIIYNGGTGPCVELFIHYPDEFDKVTQIVNYETSWHTNKEFKNDKLQFNPRIYDEFKTYYHCEKGNCIIDAGFLAPNKVFPLEFTSKKRNINVNVTCIDIEENIIILKN
jgi:hypothetical protein